MLELKDIEEGDVVTEFQCYAVHSNDGTGISTTIEETKNTITLPDTYINSANMQSASIYEEEIMCTIKELGDVVRNNPTIAMSIAYTKQDKPKAKKDIKLEKQAIIDSTIEALRKVQKEKKGVLEEAEHLVGVIVDNPIQPTIPGEYRVIKGYHKGIFAGGLLQFVDALITEGHNIRSVNLQKIDYVIVGNKKYKKK